MDLRKEKRVSGAKEIKIRDDEQIYLGFLVDMSSKGLSIKTEHVLPCYKVIDIIMDINDKPVPIKGSVRWVNDYVEKPEDTLKEIGILLIDPPAEYLDYLTGQ